MYSRDHNPSSKDSTQKLVGFLICVTGGFTAISHEQSLKASEYTMSLALHIYSLALENDVRRLLEHGQAAMTSQKGVLLDS